MSDVKPIRPGMYRIAWFGIPYRAQVISTSSTNIKFKIFRKDGSTAIQNVRPGIFRVWMSSAARTRGAGKLMLNPKRKTKPRFTKEIKKFKDFSGKLNAKVSKKSITWPSKLILVGKAKDITYSSDKQVGSLRGGVERDYIHRFKKHGTVYTNPEGTMFVIIGVKTNLKKEGITG